MQGADAESLRPAGTVAPTVALAAGGRAPGVCTRVALRLLALTAGLLHNHDIGDPGRHFAAYGH